MEKLKVITLLLFFTRFTKSRQNQMMISESYNINTKSGTIGGLCLVLLTQVNWYELLHSIIIAAVGATTSFLVSFVLNRITKKLDP